MASRAKGPGDLVSVNRAPVLTLWAAVVAERLGYRPDESLSLGKAVAGLNAQSKGRRLGIYEERPKGERTAKPKAGPELVVEVLGRSVPAKQTDQGLRALAGDKTVDALSAERYLERAFGERLPEVRAAMEQLAKGYKPEELEAEAFGLYEQFRPSVPPGVRGWGAKGKLDLSLIRSLRG